ncbi:MAG: FtsX-like permease family protein [Gemmatales bacterium]|nr:FtsX-like permease family protein [Gemmatales bacterium]
MTKFLLLILKNLRRNPVRVSLTGLAVVVLVTIYVLIQSVLTFLDQQVQERTTNIRLIITERFRIPSRFPKADFDRIVLPGGETYARLVQLPGYVPDAWTLWHFIAFSLDADMTRRDPNRFFFAIATLPEKIPTMIEGLEGLDPRLCEKLKNPGVSGMENAGLLLGPKRLARLGVRVGDRLQVYSLSHRDRAGQMVKMDFVVVGVLPENTRWDESAFVDYEYIERTLTDAGSELAGRINLGWVTVLDQATAQAACAIIESQNRNIKCETAATAVNRFFEPLKDILFGVRYILVPTILVVMAVVVSNAIGITVRERTTEIAVLKVLGFTPAQILVLILGEGVLIGLLGGLLGVALPHVVVNYVFKGIRLPLGFFPIFFVPTEAYYWGPWIGTATALMGSLWPAINGCRVQVAEIFRRVA